MFGISGIDYCEEIGLNVWNSGGLLDFLQRMKKAGRLGAIFCSTHGSPEYAARLVASGCFDAVMLAYNPLGFHVLSYHGAAEGKAYEDLQRNRDEIFRLAREHRVGLLVIKPLAGGLLCRSRAFPARERFSEEHPSLTASEVLRTILQHPEVSAVVPGAACPEEAEENAIAGHEPLLVSQREQIRIESAIAGLRLSLCSRCGACEPTCSHSLPISWLFREGYIWNYPSDTFEALGRLHYFRLQRDAELACARCTERTCRCPSGLDIPTRLERVHQRMLWLRKEGLLHATPEELESGTIRGHVSVRVVCRELPRTGSDGRCTACRLWIENAGEENWLSFCTQPQVSRSLALVVSLDGREVQKLPLLHDVGPGQRTHFTFELDAPNGSVRCAVELTLADLLPDGRTAEATCLFAGILELHCGGGEDPPSTVSGWGTRLPAWSRGK
jgi:predicted aldo/keto reductase-like oxidoreductase